MLVIVCVGGACGDEIDPLPDDFESRYSDLKPYLADGPYASTLKRCVGIGLPESACFLGSLPMIGMDTSDPSDMDILEHVVVSHDWMGDRFAELLPRLPEDVKLLLRSVTAVVIDGDIRPSHYWGITGAIYLDPEGLWLTNAEKATISKQSDFRSGFGSDLEFVHLARYVKDNDWAFEFFSLEGNEQRALEDILSPFARLLFHELAHANDFAPATFVGLFDREDTVAEALVSLEAEWLSNKLYESSPLTSLILQDLAQVSFFGDDPSEAERTIEASTVGELMQSDAANHYYAYSNQREDLAMLFEAVMMKYHYDAELDTGFAIAPEQPQRCSDFVMGWGQRNRIGNSMVKPRSQQVTSGVLPEREMEQFFAQLDPEQSMRSGEDWCENLVLGDSNIPQSYDRTAVRFRWDDLLPPH